MEERDVVRALGALAQGLRLQIFRVLVVAGRTGMTPGALAEQLDVPAATLSFHLKELMHAGLVTQERLGRYLIHPPALEQMNAMIGHPTANCCHGDPRPD